MSVQTPPKTKKRTSYAPLPPQNILQAGSNVMLNVDDLNIDHTYQRPLHPNHVQKMATEFDLKRLFRIAVNQRPNGKYYILDGQQRVSAIKLMGGDYVVDCVLYQLASVQEEAELYYQLNWDRKNPNAADRWKARLAQGDPGVVRIQRELDSVDIKLYNSTNMPRSIKAISTLMHWIDIDVEIVSTVVMILGKLDYMEPIAAEVVGGLCVLENHMREHSTSLVRARTGKETYAGYITLRGYSKLREAAFMYQQTAGKGGTTRAKSAAKGMITYLNYKKSTHPVPLMDIR